MKQLARSYFWWAVLDAEIDKMVNSRSHCLAHRPNPEKAKLHPWEWPEKPWSRIHIDHAGPYKGFYFLVIVDSHSKWVEVFPTHSMKSFSTITFLRSCFARFGLPSVIVSDNGPSFTSREFHSFLSKLGVHHITTAIYKPSTNGLAERMVRTFKEALSGPVGEGNIQEKLDSFLFKYRITPHATTGVSPAQLMFGRNLKCVFDLLHPFNTIQKKVVQKQNNQKCHYPGNRDLSLDPNNPVMIRMYSGPNKWKPATVISNTGPVSARCIDNDGQEHRRHHNQIIPRIPEDPPAIEDPQVQQDNVEELLPVPVVASPTVPRSRSGRQIKPPVRLNL